MNIRFYSIGKYNVGEVIEGAYGINQKSLSFKFAMVWSEKKI